jgi:cobalt-zinc-cadmium efflux system membrane fusion protein
MSLRGMLQILLLLVIAAAGTAAGVRILALEPSVGAIEEDHGDEHGGEAGADGPHGGRLLKKGGFALEVTIYEKGVPPEYRVYAYRNGEPLNPADVNLSIQLNRLGGEIDTFEFQPRGDCLIGNGVVREPHSFDVGVRAGYGGRNYAWDYESYEGRTQIAPETAEGAGIETAKAGPVEIREILTLQGTVEYDFERLRRAMARFPGIILSLSARIGDRVQAGEALAEVESNDSLQTYAVRAPIEGVITQKLANTGETTRGGPLYTIADLRQVWVDLAMFRNDLARVKVGQSVRVRSLDEELEATGKIGYIAPNSSSISQSTTARVFLNNPYGVWQPGMAVTGEVVVAEEKVPIGVRTSALQTYRDFDVVFAKVDNTYEVRMLELGRSDETHTEVLSGLDPGTEYVVENSYLIKADIEKASAEHAH